MPNSTSFWDHPIDKLEEALSIRKQIAALQAKLGGLFGGSDGDVPKVKRGPKAGKRSMSPEARERIAAAQRARWATKKGATSAVAEAPSSGKKKRNLTPAGRAKLAAAMKARWAARKSGASAPNAPGTSKTGTNKGKRVMSPEARAKIAAAAKKRWAEKKSKG
jgi:hypothetical protein